MFYLDRLARLHGTLGPRLIQGEEATVPPGQFDARGRLLLNRSAFGFELRAVGANPAASKTAGISVAKTYTLLMVVAGGLAGLGGVGSCGRVRRRRRCRCRWAGALVRIRLASG